MHHHLVREGTRLQAGLVLESGEPREVHHIATLLGYGASAVNPYLMLETLDELATRAASPGVDDRRRGRARTSSRRSARACSRRSPRWGSRRSSPTAARRSSRRSASSRTLVDRHFTGTASRIGGVGLDVLAQEALDRHARACPRAHDDLLPVGGVYAWRRDGEHHMWNPETIALLQHAVRANGTAQRRSTRSTRGMVNEDATRKATLRGLLKFRERPRRRSRSRRSSRRTRSSSASRPARCRSARSPRGARDARDRDEPPRRQVEHGRGRGGPAPLHADPNGDWRRSAIKQVASGRFGVTVHYLVNADELQIKMAQGAKPGEGGQLPGHKVDDYIAKIRHSTPGVGLISPPPHHDIYSIEDLKQLIYDLRCANPRRADQREARRPRSASARSPPASRRPTPTTS